MILGIQEWIWLAATVAFLIVGAIAFLTFREVRKIDEDGGIELIDGAGHWIQQEQPARLGTILLAFMKEVDGADHKRG